VTSVSICPYCGSRKYFCCHLRGQSIDIAVGYVKLRPAKPGKVLGMEDILLRRAQSDAVYRAIGRTLAQAERL
jgi:hypothetical protein